MNYIVAGGAVLLLLTAAKGLFPTSLHFLPLGGSTIAEMGIVFGIAVAAATIHEMRSKRKDG